jgi:glycosyltransferase involved in cell wall biosynthesis
LRLAIINIQNYVFEGDIVKRILFLIPNLMHGGAEKVLVNLVNNLDANKYDVTVQTLFDIGVNKQYLNDNIKYKYSFKYQFRGNSHLFKLFTPKLLYKFIVNERYDILVSYLEGDTARIISGCNDLATKKVAWIHSTPDSVKDIAVSFRNIYEAKACYETFDKIIFVSSTIEKKFIELINLKTQTQVLYNTNETEKILEKSTERISDVSFTNDSINICSVGKVISIKGFGRLARIHKKLIQEGIHHHIYILGIGNEQNKIEKYLKENNLSDTFIFIGYKDNPYKYVARCDLYVCSSYSEGFSTAVTESLIVGTPVITTQCSGMEEILGKDSKYGLIVENDENDLYKGIRKMLNERNLLKHYKQMAIERGRSFTREKTIKEVEVMLDNL